MKPHILFCLAIIGTLSLINCAGSQQLVIQGDGNIVTREIPAIPFNGIKIQGNRITVNYMQREEEKPLTVNADQNILDLYNIEIRNRILYIEPKKELINTTLRPTHFLVETSSQHLQRIETLGSANFNLHSPLHTDELTVEVRGSGKVNLEQPVEYGQMMVRIAGSGELNSEKLNGTELFANISGSGKTRLVANNYRTELRVSGSGQFHIMELSGKELTSTISGSGGAYMNGRIERADLTISGSGFIRAADLKVDHTTCRVSGSGNLEINAIHNLEAKISGSGSIRYKGDPYIKQQISGSGKLTKIQ